MFLFFFIYFKGTFRRNNLFKSFIPKQTQSSWVSRKPRGEKPILN